MKSVILCQSCLDRQVESPNEAIGQWANLPICDECLGPLMDNLANSQTQTVDSDPNSLPARIERSKGLLIPLEVNWELTEEEVLKSRDDFFNHHPPAVINLTPEEIKRRISFLKGILFAYRIKAERWATIIESLRAEERQKQGLINVTKSIKEVSKKSKTSKAQLEKLAKALKMDISTLENVGQQARIEEFGNLPVSGEKGTKIKTENEYAIKSALTQLQSQLKAENKIVETPKKVVRCQVCGKLTCVCPKVK